jgi:hypothetical protein
LISSIAIGSGGNSKAATSNRADDGKPRSDYAHHHGRAEEHNRFGPPPTEFFDPMPHDDLIRPMVSDVRRLRAELDSDTRNAILTLACIWSTVATGTIRSKDNAAAWALEQLSTEHRPPLAHARAVYLGEQVER